MRAPTANALADMEDVRPAYEKAVRAMKKADEKKDNKDKSKKSRARKTKTKGNATVFQKGFLNKKS